MFRQIKMNSLLIILLISTVIVTLNLCLPSNNKLIPLAITIIIMLLVCLFKMVRVRVRSLIIHVRQIRMLIKIAIGIAIKVVAKLEVQARTTLV